MNRSLKRLTAMLMVVFMFIAAVPMQMLTAHAATGKITFSDPTVTVGEQVSVKMKIASSDGSALGASDVRLQYDSSALEFVSGTSANGGAGSIRVIGAMESAKMTNVMNKMFGFQNSMFSIILVEGMKSTEYDYIDDVYLEPDATVFSEDDLIFCGTVVKKPAPTIAKPITKTITGIVSKTAPR